jgi:ketosteroid isomerase-like protein
MVGKRKKEKSMKRVMYSLTALGLVLVGLGFYTSQLPGYAQEPAKPEVRTEVADTLSKFVEAANKGDGPTLAALLSNKPEMTYVVDGVILHGPEEIKKQFNDLVGLQGKYQFQLGAMDISSIHEVTVACGPYTLKVKGDDAAVSLKGAVSFVLDKQKGAGWTIAHMHRSTASVEKTTAKQP